MYAHTHTRYSLRDNSLYAVLEVYKFVVKPFIKQHNAVPTAFITEQNLWHLNILKPLSKLC